MLRIKILRPETVLILAFLTIAACFVVYGNLVTSRSKPANSEIAQTVASGSVTAKLEVELVTVRASGFEPAEIVRPKGPFVLLVDDRSGKETSSLKLQRINGDHMRDVNTKRMKSEWHDVVNLPPGDYVLTDAANPDSHCQITILP